MPRLGLYQPFIEDRNVRRLYQLKVRFKRQHKRVPMTVLINRILDDFFDAERNFGSEEEIWDRHPSDSLVSPKRQEVLR